MRRPSFGASGTTGPSTITTTTDENDDMTWTPATSNGLESRKIRHEVLHYLAAGGFDVGCGVEKVWPHLLGLDSGKDLQLFGAPVKPDVLIPDAARLSLFADGVANNVFSSHLLEHIVDWQAALREWWRVLAIGGHLVLYLPHADHYPRRGEPGANPDHKHDFVPEEIIDAMCLLFPDWALLECQTRSAGDEYSFLLVFRKLAAGIGQSEPWCDLKPEKRAGIVRMGGNGDALWAASVAAHLHDQGYAVTCYVAANGEEMLRHDPHIAELRVIPRNVLSDDEAIEYWCHQAPQYQRWVNLHGSVENRLLPHQSAAEFYLPTGVRRKLMGGNYVDTVHLYAELPASAKNRQRFYPAPFEREWARLLREQMSGKVVVLAPSGSGPFKGWPHAQRFMEILADHRVHTFLLGDLAHLPGEVDHVERDGVEYGSVMGQEWPLRLALAWACQADAVVGTESVIANAVANERMPKVVLLSHSSRENLTRDWKNTISLESPVACHPCHRIHNHGGAFCPRQPSGAAACMESYSAETVAALVLTRLGIRHPIGEPAGIVCAEAA